MREFLHVATLSQGPTPFMTGLTSPLLLRLPEGLHAYVVSAGGGGVMLVDLGAKPSVIASHAFVSAQTGLGAARRIEITELNGGPVLLASGHAGGTIDVFPLLAEGGFGTSYLLRSPSGPALPGGLTALEVLPLGARPVFAVTSRLQDGITLWEQSARRDLSPLSVTPEAGRVLAGAELAFVEGGSGRGHLLAFSGANSTLLSFELGATGGLMLRDQIRPSDGLAISAGSVLGTARLEGQSYVLLGAAGSGSLVSVALSEDGGLRIIDHVMDDLHTRFGRISALSVLEEGGQVLIAAAGADDGVALFSLLPGGRLLHLLSIPQHSGMALFNPTGLALSWSGATLDLVVTGGTGGAGAGAGITRLQLHPGAVGVTRQAGPDATSLEGSAGRDILSANGQGTRIRAGAGDDVLIDGAGEDHLSGEAGADIFLLTPDGKTDQILDFEPGIDRIDLSAFGRFYSMDAIGFTPRADGAELQIGGETLRIFTADKRPLSLAELRIEDLRGPAHLSVAPPAPEDIELRGGTGADFLQGGAGDDTLIGGAGADHLHGHGGDDLLIGADQTLADDFAAQIYRLYRAALGRDPDDTGLLGWRKALSEGTKTLSEVAEAIVQSREFQTRFGTLDHRGYVTLLYENVLGRAPDAAGLAGWTGLLSAGTRRPAEVLLGFSESAEFQSASLAATLLVSEEGLRMRYSGMLFRLYDATLDRLPDAAGYEQWLEILAGGRDVLAVMRGFTQSAEFKAVYGAPAAGDFVRLLYENVLERAPDAAGLAQWTALLERGARSREEVLRDFVQSPEFIAQSYAPLKAWMTARGADDHLDGGAGDNLLMGGLMRDVFIFDAQALGRTVVVGLEPWDLLSFQGFGYHSPTDVAAHLSASPDGAVFSDQGLSLLFFATDPNAVLAADFLF